MKPVDIYLDVDGVTIPCFDPAQGVRGSGWTDWRGQSHTHGRDEPVRGLTAWSPRMVKRLTALSEADHVQVWWCTTWGTRARDELAPAIGLPEFPVLDEDRAYMRAEDAMRTVSSWWKRDAVQSHHRGRPGHRVVWIDDDLGFDEKARLWMRGLGDDGLGITPDTRVGLTAQHMKRVETFVLDATSRA